MGADKRHLLQIGVLGVAQAQVADFVELLRHPRQHRLDVPTLGNTGWQHRFRFEHRQQALAAAALAAAALHIVNVCLERGQRLGKLQHTR